MTVTTQEEHILRKALGQPFTTESKHRIRRGYTIVIRRCKEIMKHLWQCNHKTFVSQDDLDQAIFFNAGGDYRTLKRYRGFELYSRGRKDEPRRRLKHVPGYLERLRYIKRVGALKYQVLHEVVDLSYHREQTVFSRVFGSKMNSHISKLEMCVCKGEKDGMEEKEAIAPSTTKNQQTTTHTPHTFLKRCRKHSKNKPSHQRRGHNGRWATEARKETL